MIQYYDHQFDSHSPKWRFVIREAVNIYMASKDSPPDDLKKMKQTIESLLSEGKIRIARLMKDNIDHKLRERQDIVRSIESFEAEALPLEIFKEIENFRKQNCELDMTVFGEDGLIGYLAMAKGSPNDISLKELKNRHRTSDGGYRIIGDGVHYHEPGMVKDIHDFIDDIHTRFGNCDQRRARAYLNMKRYIENLKRIETQISSDAMDYGIDVNPDMSSCSINTGKEKIIMNAVIHALCEHVVGRICDGRDYNYKIPGSSYDHEKINDLFHRLDKQMHLMFYHGRSPALPNVSDEELDRLIESIILGNSSRGF